MTGIKERLGLDELSAKGCRTFLATLLAEFIGTMFLNFFGCASTIGWASQGATVLQIAFAFGLAGAGVIQAIGHVSGGHINPAVTCAMMITGNIPIIRGLAYIIVQCLGAVAGSGILRGLTPDDVAGNLGSTLLHAKLTAPQAFGMEFFLGFILLLVVFGVCDPPRNLGNNAPLAIGFAILVGHLAAIPYTGSSMNPARSFGSAVISGHWDNHWIYWIGPILGGIVAGLTYTYAFAMRAPHHEDEVERRVELQQIGVKKGGEFA